MSFGRDEDAIGVLRVNENRGDLLRVAKIAHVQPGFSGVGRFEDAVARGKVRTLKTFTAADIDDVWIGGSNGESADGAGRLVVEDGNPSVAKIGGLPNAAVNRGHVEDIGLMRDATDGDGAASAEGANAAPAHFGEKLLIILLTEGGNRRTRE